MIVMTVECGLRISCLASWKVNNAIGEVGQQVMLNDIGLRDWPYFLYLGSMIV